MNRFIKITTVVSLTTSLSLAQEDTDITVTEVEVTGESDNTLATEDENTLIPETTPVVEDSTGDDDDTANPPTGDTTDDTVDTPDETGGDDPIVDAPEEEEPEEPKLPKPEDLTGNAEEMRYVGWNLPKECNKLEVGSVMAVFCPDLRYLMHT